MSPAALKDLFDRTATAMARHHEMGRSSGHTRVRMAPAGLACEVEHEDRTQRVDLPAADGGDGSAPHPGQLMRASLGACLSMGYRLWAARLEVPIEAVELEITCDYDARGQMGVSDDVPVGWREIRIHVTVTSDAPHEEIERVVQTTHRLSPMLANLSSAIRQTHHLVVQRG